MRKILSATLSATMAVLAVLLATSMPVWAQNYQAIGGQTGSPVEPEVLIIADNQQTFDYGWDIDEQQYRVNWITPTARRNTITNLYTLAFTEQIIAESDAKLVLHAGDALNNGCKSEFTRFSAAMNRTNKPWFIAPGNHDVSYLGISHPLYGKRANSGNKDGIPLNSIGGWGGLCFPMRVRDNHRAPITKKDVLEYVYTKRSFVKAYLNELRSRDKLDTDKPVLPKFLPDDHSDGLVCETSPNIVFLHRLCWYISDENKRWNNQETWKDFLIQEVRWKNKKTGNIVSAIMIDTSNYAERPRIARPCRRRNCEFIGGLRASILQKQRVILERWLRQNKQNGIATVLVGHHPFRKPNLFGKKDSSAVSRGMRKWSGGLAKRFPQLVSISAHTHSGYMLSRKKKSTALAEFNVGSLTDVPLEAFRLNWINANSIPSPRLSRILFSKIPKRKKRPHRGFSETKRPINCLATFTRILKQNPRAAIRPAGGWTKTKFKFSGLVSQLKSLHKEAAVFAKVLPYKGESVSSNPVCYRIKETDNNNCGQEGRSNKCATYNDVSRCGEWEREPERFINLKVLTSQADATALARSVEKELMKAFREKFIANKAIRLRREVARKLHAITIFDEINRASDVPKYRQVRACLALVAGYEQRINKNRWWR